MTKEELEAMKDVELARFHDIASEMSADRARYPDDVRGLAGSEEQAALVVIKERERRLGRKLPTRRPRLY
ncbi:hypothetical protein [Frigoribacterium sp. SL97]|uniref:hypothetical protein n=1 Tax=Frigoribacterium sp. SL97 TaxID=2994664 RepID=UPI0022713EA9|nr:hypothetical protein [Frigoribacterium sp. SL97]WAC50353.1 hypothetical protein OVA02_10660 [Frigoribacterium sp. SL97]